MTQLVKVMSDRNLLKDILQMHHDDFYDSIAKFVYTFLKGPTCYLAQ